MADAQAEDGTCGCHWSRDAAGRPEFRECSDHYVARVFPPGTGGGA